MKISYRTHPVLEKIKNQKLGSIRIHELDESLNFSKLLPNIEELWGAYSRHFDSIDIITNPFAIAIDKSREKLCDPELYKNEVGIRSGTFIFNGGQQSICYYIRLGKGESDFEFLYFKFHNKDILTSVRFIDQDYHFGWVSQAFGYKSHEKEKIERHFLAELGDISLTIKFIKYADVQVKYIGANKRLKETDCKYINDTRSDIRILDSTWFTTLVKTEGFNVRGHFRLQPCGKGMRDKKLIWISEFEKHGYTRHFKRPVSIDEFQLQ